jgi:hypothetical protein
MRSFLEPGAIPPIPGLSSERSARPAAQVAREEATRFGSIAHATVEDAVVLNAPARARRTVDDAFALALAKSAKPEVAGAKRLWIGWILPNTHQAARYFYPVMNEGKTSAATLRVPETAGATIWSPSISGRTVTWTEVKKTTTTIKRKTLPGHQIQMTFRKGEELEAVSDDGTPVETINLTHLLAGCYVPSLRENYGNDAAPFPLNWNGATFPLNAVRLQQPKVRRDERLREPDHPAQSPRRNLDPDHPYDEALMRATDLDSIEEAGDAFAGSTPAQHADRQLRDQALGNQAYLLKSFADDAQFLAAETRLDDKDAPACVTFSDTITRPTLVHLGLVVGVVAEECPPWLLQWTEDAAEAQFSVTEPHLTVDSDGNDLEVSFDGGIKPVIDFRQADFSENPPTLNNVLARADSETLNIGWDLDWGALGMPLGEWTRDSVPAPPDPEDYLRSYQIELFVDGVEDSLGTIEAGPGDLLVGTGEGESPVRLKLRYQFNVTMEELGLSPEVSVARRFVARITPIAQDGTRGRTWPADAVQRPSATPLAADDATLEVSFDDNGVADDDVPTMGGRIEWRELVPPTRADVAATERWQLILRPLEQLPLGAYPTEASDTSDPGVLGVGGGVPRDGDIVLVLKPMDALMRGPFIESCPIDPPFAEGDGTRPPKLHRWRLKLDQTHPGDRPLVADIADVVLDHNDRPVPQGDTRLEVAQSFLDRTPIDAEWGRGWRVFLRAMAAASNPEESLLGPVSDMVRVRMRIDGLKNLPGEEERIGAMPLDHLEWLPSEHPLPSQMFGVEATQGPIHHATIIRDLDGLRIDYLPVPGRDRGVEILWSAAHIGMPVESVAVYEVYEASLDGLTNFHRAATKSGQAVPGFDLDWRKLRDIRPADRDVAQRAVTSFLQPEVWDSTPPSEHAILSWILDEDTCPNGTDKIVASEDMEDNRPGWYSWAESELTWPEWFEAAERTLIKAGRRSNLSPYAEAFEARGRPPGELGLDELRTILAARRDLGEHCARRRLHPWLLMVTGTLAAQGAPATLTGADGPGRYEVEISPGKPFIAAEGRNPTR